MPTTPLTLPTVIANLSLVIPVSLAIDLNTIWLQNYTGQIATLGAPVAATDTAIILEAAPATPFPLNVSVLIDGEPMLVTAVTGYVLTVSRGVAAYPFLAALGLDPPSAHANGASVCQLLYTRPWDMLLNQALRPWVQQQVIALGGRSVTFGAMASGSITLNTSPSSN